MNIPHPPLAYANKREVQSGDIFIGTHKGRPVRGKITHLKGGPHKGLCTIPIMDAPADAVAMVTGALHIEDAPKPAPKVKPAAKSPAI